MYKSRKKGKMYFAFLNIRNSYVYIIDDLFILYKTGKYDETVEKRQTQYDKIQIKLSLVY